MIGGIQLPGRHSLARRAHGQVGEKQVGGGIALHAALRLNLPIERQQPQGLVGLPVDQAPEIQAQRFQRSPDQADRGFADVSRLRFDRPQQTFQRFGELRDTVQSDDGQRALYLMQVRAAKPYLRRIRGSGHGAGAELIERLNRALQRQIDLALDPGQRADIKFRRGIHLKHILRSRDSPFSPL